MDSKAGQFSRREMIQRVMAAAAAIAVLDGQTFGADSAVARPYGTDPLLNKTYQPGDFWPLTLDDTQKAATRALADLVLPADGEHPAASEVGTVEFIDEWISAPYAVQQADRVVVLEGLIWLDRESDRRFGSSFAGLSLERRAAIADDICYLERAKPEFKTAADFFAKFRNLVAGGYYATPKGCKDIGYVGNTPSLAFGGPSKKVLEQLGLTGA